MRMLTALLVAAITSVAANDIAVAKDRVDPEWANRNQNAPVWKGQGEADAAKAKAEAECTERGMKAEFAVFPGPNGAKVYKHRCVGTGALKW